MSKISGPLLDRIDIHIEVPAVPYKELTASSSGANSQTMRNQVTQAREIQRCRFGKSAARQNAHMSHRQIREHCRLDEAGMNLLRSTMTELGLSARAHDKILRVARTIADLEGAESISSMHLSEAVNYRMLDRQLWK